MVDSTYQKILDQVNAQGPVDSNDLERSIYNVTGIPGITQIAKNPDGNFSTQDPNNPDWNFQYTPNGTTGYKTNNDYSEMLAVAALMAGGGFASSMLGGAASALPAGGMTATGTVAPWSAANTLGTGFSSVGMPGAISPELLGTGLSGSMTAAANPLAYNLGGSIMAGAPGTLSEATGLGSAVTNFANMGAGLTPIASGLTPSMPSGAPPSAPNNPATPSAPNPLSKLGDKLLQDPRLLMTGIGALSSLLGSHGATGSGASGTAGSSNSQGLDWNPTQKQWADSYFNSAPKSTVIPYQGDLARAPIEGGEHVWFGTPSDAAQSTNNSGGEHMNRHRGMAQGGHVKPEKIDYIDPVAAYRQSMSSGQPIDMGQIQTGQGWGRSPEQAFNRINKFYDDYSRPTLSPLQQANMAKWGLSQSQLAAPDFHQLGLTTAPGQNGEYHAHPQEIHDPIQHSSNHAAPMPSMMPPVLGGAPTPVPQQPMDQSGALGQMAAQNPQPMPINPSPMDAPQTNQPYQPQAQQPNFGWSNPSGWPAMAEGGAVSGALAKMHAGMVQGHGGGQQDNVHTMLSPGEYVFDADTVSGLGDGNSDHGAQVLDAMRQQIREHLRSAGPDSIPPAAKSPLEYMRLGMGGK